MSAISGLPGMRAGAECSPSTCAVGPATIYGPVRYFVAWNAIQAQVFPTSTLAASVDIMRDTARRSHAVAVATALSAAGCNVVGFSPESEAL